MSRLAGRDISRSAGRAKAETRLPDRRVDDELQRGIVLKLDNFEVTAFDLDHANEAVAHAAATAAGAALLPKTSLAGLPGISRTAKNTAINGLTVSCTAA